MKKYEKGEAITAENLDSLKCINAKRRVTDCRVF